MGSDSPFETKRRNRRGAARVSSREYPSVPGRVAFTAGGVECKHLDGSLNDVVLSIVAGAVRRRLRGREIELRDLDFRITIPVDTRQAGEDEGLANKVSAWFISLPVGEADPRGRFDAIREQTRERKERRADKAFDLFMQLAD